MTLLTLSCDRVMNQSMTAMAPMSNNCQELRRGNPVNTGTLKGGIPKPTYLVMCVLQSLHKALPWHGKGHLHVGTSRGLKPSRAENPGSALTPRLRSGLDSMKPQGPKL